MSDRSPIGFQHNRATLSIALSLALIGVAAAPADAESVHRRGVLTLKLEGIHVPAQKPHESGPYTMTLIDFDAARQLTRTVPAADVGVGVAVRESAFSLSVPPGQRIAVAGAAAPTYSRCVQLLAASDKGEGPYEKPPGVYHCVRTNEGRVARLRVLSSQTDFKDDFFRDVFVRVEGRVWNP